MDDDAMRAKAKVGGSASCRGAVLVGCRPVKQPGVGRIAVRLPAAPPPVEHAFCAPTQGLLAELPSIPFLVPDDDPFLSTAVPPPQGLLAELYNTKDVKEGLTCVK